MPQQPDPNAPPESIILQRFDGLKNTEQAERLGPRDLVKALNVALSDTGQLSRRRGFTQKVVGRAHSLYQTTEGLNLAVLNDAVGFLNPDYSFQSLRSGIGSDPANGLTGVAYAQVGTNVYYSCPTNSGVISTQTRTIRDWGPAQDFWLSPVVNPTPNLQPIKGKLLGKPPLATALAAFRGKIYLAVNNYVWATELYLYDYVNRTDGFWPFEQPVTMLGVVGDGIYVGTAEGLWFMSPSKDYRPEQAYGLMKIERIMDSPVIPGSVIYFPAELGNPPQIPLDQDTTVQRSIAFMTVNGWCVAQDGGQAYNMTENKFFFPSAASASAGYQRLDGTNQYIASLQSGGTPQNAAAIGDFVEATLIRASSLTD